MVIITHSILTSLDSRCLWEALGQSQVGRRDQLRFVICSFGNPERPGSEASHPSGGETGSKPKAFAALHK
jgi:hypothetical protein